MSTEGYESDDIYYFYFQDYFQFIKQCLESILFFHPLFSSFTFTFLMLGKTVPTHNNTLANTSRSFKILRGIWGNTENETLLTVIKYINKVTT